MTTYIIIKLSSNNKYYVFITKPQNDTYKQTDGKDYSPASRNYYNT